jgi:PST family polysaccharide transporter
MLKGILLRGAGYLLFRQAIGTGLSFVGVLILARLLGPAGYGIFASAFAVILYIFTVLQIGVAPCLLVGERELDRDRIGHACALLVTLSVLGSVVATIGVFFLGLWLDLGRFPAVFAAMAPALPLMSAGLIPTVILDRSMDYRRIATVEASNQISQFAISVGVALFYPGIWALVLGFWAAVLAASLSLALFAPQGFRPVWNPRAMRALALESLPFAGPAWITQLRVLANPFIVGIAMGPEQVGVIALTVRLVTALGVIREIIRRLATSGMRGMRHDHARLRRFVERATEMQAFLVGVPLLLFSLILPVLIERGFGSAWRGIDRVFPLVAIAYVMAAMPNVPACLLAIMHRNRPVIVTLIAQVVLLWVATAALTPFLGIASYGCADILAALTSAIALVAVRDAIGPLDWTQSLLGTAAICIALCWPFIGYWAFVPLCMLVVSSRTRQNLIRSAVDLRYLRSPS